MIVNTPSILYAALLGLLLIALSVNVVLARRRYRVGLGVGSDEGMHQAVRVQANFAEYVPLAVVLLVLSELSGLPIGAVHAAGIVLVTSRLLHAWGLSRSPGRTFGRFYGTAGTWLVMIGLSLWLLFAAIDFSPVPGSG
jgi:uncharacterized membrane protein YecN with MAPEG domain